jgi:hypothetical protein
MEQTYHTILEGDEPTLANLLLLFSIFAGATLAWTPQLLQKLHATPEEAKAALIAYTHLAMAILDRSVRLPPSTIALAAMGNLSSVVTNSDGYRLQNHVIRVRCILMTREMQIHRLDTARSCEERRINGFDGVEIEIQRRVWWHMVASDW